MMVQIRPAKIAAFVVFVLAALTDFLDGYLARKWNATTVAGARLDPLADKILVDGTMLCICILNSDLWIVALIFIGRDVLVGAMRQIVRRRGQDIPVSMIGKTKTTLQMIGVGLLLGVRAFAVLPNTSWILNICSGLGVIALLLAFIVALVSGVDYVIKGCKIL